MTIPHSFPWPLVVIDFEASSLEEGSFPVEVGLAMLRAPGETMTAWSTLIAPTTEWRQSGHWSRRSQAIHGLDRDRLTAEGQPVEAVASTLKKFIRPGLTVWCDGGDYDRYWFSRLFAATTIKPHLNVQDVGNLIAPLPPERADVFKATRASSQPRHRAGDDALRLLIAVAEAFDLPFDPAAEHIAGPLPFGMPP